MKELVLKKGQTGSFTADSDFTISVQDNGTVKVIYDSCFITKSIVDKFNPKFKIGDIIYWRGIQDDKARKILDICGDKKDGYQYNLEDMGWYNVESVDKTADIEMTYVEYLKQNGHK